MKQLGPWIRFNHAPVLARKHKKDIQKSIDAIIASGIFLHGEKCKELEKNLKNFFGNKYFVVLTASGHDALYLALATLSLKPQDEVIIPANSYPTAFPVVLSGAKMILVDVDKNGQIDPGEIKKKITKNTKAIIAAHLYGLTGDIVQIKQIAKKNKVVLIEDCAQSFGSSFAKKPVGTFGEIGCFSLYPTKNLPTLGDGGFVITKNKKYYDFFLQAASYGEKTKYNSNFSSFHSRLPEIQAGITNIFFASFSYYSKARQNLYQYYLKKIKQAGLLEIVRPLVSHPRSSPVPHLFVVEAKNPDKLKEGLEKNDIETHIHYPAPIHLVPAFKKHNFKKGDFPMAERLSNNILSLPFHQFLTKKEIDYIIRKIKEN